LDRYARPPPDDREEPVSKALTDDLASMALFGDLSRPQLEQVAHTFEEQWFAEGERILRQGIAGSGFYIIMEGEVGIDLDGKRVNTLARGQHFGEGSVLLGEPPSADVTALRPVRCLALGPDEMKQFLLDHPTVMYRMLQEEARRFLAADR
jgi:CRP-like cAMP-binding protein